MDRQTLNLFENAIDSLQEGMRTFVESHPPKFWVQHIAQASELLLKQRVADVNPELIFKGPKKEAGRKRKTITVSEALDLLQVHDVSLDAQDRENLLQITEWSNDAKHFQIDIPVVKAREAIGALLKFVFDFLQNHLTKDPRECLEASIMKPAKKLIYSYEERLKKADSALSWGDPKESFMEVRNYCSHCDNNTVDEDGYCYFCEENIKLEECSHCGSAEGELCSDGRCEGCTHVGDDNE